MTTPPQTFLERPILMTGSMVCGILEDRKNQTRRTVKPQPVFEGVESYGDSWSWRKGKDWFSGVTTAQLISPIGLLHESRIYARVGDRLWVKETFYIDHTDYLGKLTGLPPLSAEETETFLYYAADGDVCQQIPECECHDGGPKLRPSIFMPRWASRITLEVTAMRVERLQAITAADAIAEGIEPLEHGGETFWKNYQFSTAHPNNGAVITAAKNRVLGYRDPIQSYRSLTNAINGPDHWDKNPWVWVVGFKRMGQSSSSALPENAVGRRCVAAQKSKFDVN